MRAAILQKKQLPQHTSYFAKHSSMLLLAGALAFSSCAKVETQPEAKLVKQNKRQEQILLYFNLNPFSLPIMHPVKRDGFFMLVGSDSLFEKADRLALAIEEYQLLLPEKCRPKLAVIANYFGGNMLDSEFVSLQMNAKGGNTIYARGDAPAFNSEKRLRRSVFHELCHLYMDNAFDSADNGAMETAYLSIIRLARLPAYCDTLPSALLDRHPLLGLFDESAYLKGNGTNYGHPEAGEWELFASGSTVLFFHHNELFTRLELLKKQNRKFYAAAVHALRTIVSLWKDIPLFSDEVYAKLSPVKRQ